MEENSLSVKLKHERAVAKVFLNVKKCLLRQFIPLSTTLKSGESLEVASYGSLKSGEKL